METTQSQLPAECNVKSKMNNNDRENKFEK